MNKDLYQLYNKYWFKLFENLGDRKDFANPFLIKVDHDKIRDSDLKVMIIGQETKGWGEENEIYKSIDKNIDLYDRFFIKERFYDGYGRSAFWKGFRYIDVSRCYAATQHSLIDTYSAGLMRSRQFA